MAEVIIILKSGKLCHQRVHTDFTKKRMEHKSVYINDQVVQYENTAKYLGMMLGAKLKWKPHVKKKTNCSSAEIFTGYWAIILPN